jgi:hypothetical protein
VNKRIAAIAALALSLAGCSVYREATSSQPSTDTGWRRLITEADGDRMRHWRKAWDEALPPAKAVAATPIAADANLFDPDRALGTAMPPAGAYRCRTTKLGAQTAATRDFATYPWFDCAIAPQGEVFSLAQTDGPQRPTGLLYPETDARAIFVGTLVLGDETAPLRYGLDRSRDMIGYVERIDAARWRLVLPYPRFESKLDVIEIVPAK